MYNKVINQLCYHVNTNIIILILLLIVFMDIRGEKCEDLMALGDLVTSFTHSYIEKSQVLQCYDFITGEPKIIQIPVGVTPSDYAKSAYMKAKKLKRSLKVLENLIAKVTLHVDYLSEIEASISGLVDYVRCNL